MTEKASRQPRIPKYRHHKSTGRSVATFNGREVYFGKHGTPEARQKYDAYLAEWLNNDRKPLIPRGTGVTITELSAAYLRHAKQHYRKPDGTSTSRLHNARAALKPLIKLYGAQLVGDFGPLAFAACRSQWIEAELKRRTVNDYAAQLKNVFKWGVSQELCPVEIYQALSTVPGVRAGRTKAKESDAKKPVQQSHVEAIKPYVSRQVWALTQVQLYTGARGGELFGLRAKDIDMTGKIWIARIDQHKTAWAGKDRVILFGPKAQSAITPFLNNRVPEATLFDPRDATKEQAEARRDGPGRRENQKPSPRKTGRKIGDRYTRYSYAKAIERGCDKAGIPVWTPHRLRHNTATLLRKEYGPDLSKTVLGLTSNAVVETYAERDRDRALEAMEKLG